MPISTTGNGNLDTATAEIAIALHAAQPGYQDQYYYDEAARLRDVIMAGTRELDGKSACTTCGPVVSAR